MAAVGLGILGDTGGRGCPGSALPGSSGPSLHGVWATPAAVTSFLGVGWGFSGEFWYFGVLRVVKNKFEFAVHPSVARGAAFKKQGCLLTRVE